LKNELDGIVDEEVRETLAQTEFIPHISASEASRRQYNNKLPSASPQRNTVSSFNPTLAQKHEKKCQNEDIKLQLAPQATALQTMCAAISSINTSAAAPPQALPPHPQRRYAWTLTPNPTLPIS
jgi:hypothetical protein